MPTEEHKKAAEAHVNGFHEHVEGLIGQFLEGDDSLFLRSKYFNRHVRKLAARHGVTIAETDLEDMRVVALANMKKTISNRLHALSEENNLVAKFAELNALKEESAKNSDGRDAIRNYADASADMLFHAAEDKEQYARDVERYAEMYEELNKIEEVELVDKVNEMALLKDAIYSKIDTINKQNREDQLEVAQRRVDAQKTDRQRRRSGLDLDYRRRSIGLPTPEVTK